MNMAHAVRDLCIGRCQVDDVGSAECLRLIGVSCGGRDASHLAPDAESGIAGSTMFVGGQAMAAELEVIVDAAVS